MSISFSHRRPRFGFSTHTVAYNYLQLPLHWVQYPLLTSVTSCMNMVYIDIHKINKYFKNNMGTIAIVNSIILSNVSQCEDLSSAVGSEILTTCTQSSHLSWCPQWQPSKSHQILASRLMGSYYRQ